MKKIVVVNGTARTLAFAIAGGSLDVKPNTQSEPFECIRLPEPAVLADLKSKGLKIYDADAAPKRPDPQAGIKSELAKATKRVTELEAESKENAETLRKAGEQVKTLTAERDANGAKVMELEEKVAGLEKQVADLTKQVEDAKKPATTKKPAKPAGTDAAE